MERFSLNLLSGNVAPLRGGAHGVNEAESHVYLADERPVWRKNEVLSKMIQHFWDPNSKVGFFQKCTTCQRSYPRSQAPRQRSTKWWRRGRRQKQQTPFLRELSCSDQNWNAFARLKLILPTLHDAPAYFASAPIKCHTNVMCWQHSWCPADAF